jgi:membrane-bound lytic murein transglycosylase B
MTVARKILISFSLAFAGFIVGAPASALVDRPDVQAFIERTAKEHKLDKKQLAEALQQAQIQQSILEAMSRPAEKALDWKKYRNIFIEPKRIEGGVAFMREYADTLARAEKEYGVPASMITAIIGVETRYGRIMGNYRVIDALATLAFEYPRRSKFFTKELQQYFLLMKEQKLSPLDFKGSYAGAMGYGQFMPSSYRHYAVDFDGDGVADIWNNPVDAIGSVANYFASHGWKAGEPVVVDARLSKPVAESFFNKSLKPNYTVGDLRKRGIEVSGVSLPDATPVAAFRFQGAKGPEYRLGLKNFHVITRYNISRLYALAAYQLSQEIDAAL